MAGRVEGKVAFITGMARGQGRAHALRLAEEGADIIGVDVPNAYEHPAYPMSSQEDLDQTVAEIEKLGARVVATATDVRDRAALQAALDDGVAQLGHLDVVVASAGICALGDRPPQAFFEAVDVDLVGVLNTLSVSYPHLTAGASMIVTGSVAAMMAGGTSVLPPGGGIPSGGAGYGFAKQTVVTLVHDLALLLGPQSIRVNAVHPTNVETDLLLNDPMYKQFRPDLEAPTRDDAEPVFSVLQSMPIPYVQPVDIANAVVFLASDEARYVTGIQLRVDAGAAIKMVPGIT